MKAWRTRVTRSRLACAVMTTMTLSLSARLYAQTATAAALTSAFLYNFAKFTEWPADALAPGQRLALCVVGDNAVADGLERTTKGRAIESHELTVALVAPEGPFRACHLLYVSGLGAARSLQLLEQVKTSPVFTASDAGTFAEIGGIAQLTLEDGRIRFAINVTAAQRARLQLSSKLLNLAQIIKGEHNVQH